MPASTPIIFNLCLIISAIYIAPKYDMPIYVLAWGVFLAGFLQLLMQYFPLATIDRLPKLKLNLENKGLKKFLKLILPAILAGGIFQINLLIDTIFASLLQTGSPTWLYVSDRFVQFPMGVFAIAISTVLLPSLSKIDINSAKREFVLSLRQGQKMVLFIGMPSLIGLFFCAEDLISAIFLNGEFREVDVFQSSYSLMAFSIGLPFFMLMKVLTPAFFARKDTKTPMYVALLSLFLNATLNYYLAFILNYGHVGIALGSSISAIISVLVLEVILYKEGLIEKNNIFSRFNFSILISSLALVIFLYYFTNNTEIILMTQLNRILYLSIEIVMAVIIYFSIARLILGKSISKQFK